MLPEYKNKATSRLRKLQGQLDGIIKMIEEDRYCPDIITQLRALQGGIKATTTHVLESHLRTCAAKELTSPNTNIREKGIQEIIKAFSLQQR